MVLFNYSTKELTAKVVYYGPGLCGKTTNLQWIHEKTPIKNKGKMLSLATEADRTLFFDFLPIDLGTIRGMKTRIQLYTVPGQVFYNATRRMVLKGADCVVFVADSQEPMLDANLDAMANLKENLEANEIDPAEIPTVLQYNKRDLPNALPLEILNERLNPRGLPFYEAVAMKGQGVEETLKGATALVFKSLASKYGGGADAGAAARAATAAARPAAPAAAAARTAPPPPTPVTAPVAPAAVAAARPAPAPAAPRPAPAPVARTGPAPAPTPAAAPVMDAPPVDDLLESIELQAAPEALEEAPELAMGASPELEAISVDELSLESSPSEVPVPKPAGRTTLVKNATEADELRRRIGRSTDPELTLEPSDPDDEDIEELSFDTAPRLVPEGEAEPDGALSAPSAPAGSPAARRPGDAGPASAQMTVPPGQRPTGAREDTAPIHLSATVSSGENEIALPVEVTVQHGTSQVHIQLRITLNLKVLP
jgi:signal recognition particle receptor subunit beta